MRVDSGTFAQAAMDIQRLLYHVSYAILRNERDCEDAVQEALLKAWKKRGTLRQESAFKAWMVRIVVNTCNEQIRRRGDIPIAFDEAMPAPAREESSLGDALMTLPEDMRLPLTMYYMDGLDVKTIACALNTPEGTVKSRLSRGRERLKRYLEQEEDFS